MAAPGQTGITAHYQRVPLDQQKSQFSRMLAKLTDDNITGLEQTERQKLEATTTHFIELLKAQARQ